MGHTFKDDRARQQRQATGAGEPLPVENDFDGARWGNQRKLRTRMKVKLRREERKALPDPALEQDAPNHPLKAGRRGGWRT